MRVNAAELRVALLVMVAFPVPYGAMAVNVSEAVPLDEAVAVTVTEVLAGAEYEDELLLPEPLPPIRENGPR